MCVCPPLGSGVKAERVNSAKGGEVTADSDTCHGLVRVSSNHDVSCGVIYTVMRSLLSNSDKVVYAYISFQEESRMSRSRFALEIKFGMIKNHGGRKCRDFFFFF